MDQVREIQTVFHKFSLSAEPTDFAYWQSRPPIERLAAVEEIRREFHGADYDTKPGLQRVYRIIKR